MFRIPYADICPAGNGTLTCCGIVDEGGLWPAAGPSAEVALAKRSVALGITSDRHPRRPERLALAPVEKTIRGVHVLRTGEQTSSTPIAGVQPQLAPLVAEADAEALRVHAGTTRHIEAYRGVAFAGLEIKDLRRVQLKLENTYSAATHLRGKGQHSPYYKRSPATFAGVVVDYHTAKGYTHRAGFAVGLLEPNGTCREPRYGKGGPMDTVVDLGPIVNQGPEKLMALDLARHAPRGWDGQVWLSVGSQWAASDRRLTATVLAVNDAVRGGFLAGADPRAAAAAVRGAK